MEQRLDAIRIADMRHELEVLVFRNGRTVIVGAISQRIAQRAAEYWMKRFQRLRLFIEG
jgi:TATA-box binding protein (TBP) (component of TFIID and TFIIIB)